MMMEEREQVYRLYKFPEGKIKYMDYRQESLNDRMINYGKDVICIDFIMEDGRSFSQIVGNTLLVKKDPFQVKLKKFNELMDQWIKDAGKRFAKIVHKELLEDLDKGKLK